MTENLLDSVLNYFQYAFILITFIFILNPFILNLYITDTKVISVMMRTTILLTGILGVALIIFYSKWRRGLIVRIMLVGGSIAIISANATVPNSLLAYIDSEFYFITQIMLDSLAIIAIASVGVYFYRTIILPINEMLNITQKISQRDFEPSIVRWKINESDEIYQLYHQIVTVQSALRRDFKEIVDVLDKTSSAIKSKSLELSSGSQELKSLGEEVNSTMHQLVSSASYQSELASGGLQNIEQINEVIRQNITETRTILGIIESISKQTNVLAINAAIEAAKAGESGRGFTVVAENVRRLAENTKRNSNEIAEIMERTLEMMELKVGKIQESFQGFLSQAEELSASSEDVTAATDEQTSLMVDILTSAYSLEALSHDLTETVNLFKI